MVHLLLLHVSDVFSGNAYYYYAVLLLISVHLQQAMQNTKQAHRKEEEEGSRKVDPGGDSAGSRVCFTGCLEEA